MMVALYILLVVSFLAILGVAGAVYLRIRKKIGLPPTETQQIRKREAGVVEPAAK